MQTTPRSFIASRRTYGQQGKLRPIPGLLLAALMLGVVYFGLYPWAFNIGGRFTPWTVWNGYGKLQSSTGASYGLYVQFWLTPYRGHGGGNNLHGNAVLCTPKGMAYKYELGADVKKVWSTTEGKTTYMYFSVPSGEKSKLLSGFELVGVWRNGNLVVDDKGSMRMSFRPDGSAAGKGWTYVSPSKEHVAGTLIYGTEDDFKSLCGTITGP